MPELVEAVINTIARFRGLGAAIRLARCDGRNHTAGRGNRNLKLSVAGSQSCQCGLRAGEERAADTADVVEENDKAFSVFRAPPISFLRCHPAAIVTGCG